MEPLLIMLIRPQPHALAASAQQAHGKTGRLAQGQFVIMHSQCTHSGKVFCFSPPIYGQLNGRKA